MNLKRAKKKRWKTFELLFPSDNRPKIHESVF
jgi:hypothetical protein